MKYKPLIIYLVKHMINNVRIGFFIKKKKTKHNLHYTMLIQGLGVKANYRVKMYSNSKGVCKC